MGPRGSRSNALQPVVVETPASVSPHRSKWGRTPLIKLRIRRLTVRLSPDAPISLPTGYVGRQVSHSECPPCTSRALSGRDPPPGSRYEPGLADVRGAPNLEFSDGPLGAEPGSGALRWSPMPHRPGPRVRPGADADRLPRAPSTISSPAGCWVQHAAVLRRPPTPMTPNARG